MSDTSAPRDPSPSRRALARAAALTLPGAAAFSAAPHLSASPQDVQATDDEAVANLIGDENSKTNTALIRAIRPARRSPVTGYYHADHFAPDRKTITTAVIQAAIDAAAEDTDHSPDGPASEDGRGGVVYIPEPTSGSWEMDGSIVLKPRVTIRSGGRTRHRTAGGLPTDEWTLKGDGTHPVFITEGDVTFKDDGTVSTSTSGHIGRQVAIRDITAFNTDAPVIDFKHSNNFTIDNVHFATKWTSPNWNSGTIRIRYSYRGQVTNSELGAEGASWCLDVRDNINGVLIDGNVASGGGKGGAINLSGGIATRVTRNIIEVSKIGIRVAGVDQGDEGGATSHSCVVESNYIEQSSEPLSIGATYPFRGGRVANNWLSLPTKSDSPQVPNWAIELGRILNTDIVGNTVANHRDEPYFMTRQTQSGYDVGTGGIRLSRILGNTWYAKPDTESEKPGKFWDTSEYDTQHLTFLWGESTTQSGPDYSAPPSDWHEYTTGTISASSGTGIVRITGPAKGGRVQAVELIEATGSLGCRVTLGNSSTSIAEIMDIPDLSTVNTTHGFADLPLKAHRLLRPDQALVFRVTAGSGEGTFRLRVRWHGA